MEFGDHYYMCTISGSNFLLPTVTEGLLCVNEGPRAKYIHWMRICSFSNYFGKNIA